VRGWALGRGRVGCRGGYGMTSGVVWRVRRMFPSSLRMPLTSELPAGALKITNHLSVVAAIPVSNDEVDDVGDRTLPQVRERPTGKWTCEGRDGIA
jgi:hypothetical protein